MSTTIRLTRMGRKKRPFYRLVVLDSRKRRDGAYLANLGYYNPFCDPCEIQLHDEEIIGWLQKGAMLSETARSLLQGQGILYKYSLFKQGLPAAEVEQKVQQWRETSAAKEQKRLDAAAARKAEAEKKAAEEAAAKAKAEQEAKEAAEKAAAAEAGADAAAETAGEEQGEASAEGDADKDTEQ